MSRKPSSAVLAGKTASGGTKKASKTPGPVLSRVNVSDGKGSREVSIRKIENGYIVCESTYGGRKGYQSTERFVEKAPVLDVAVPKGKK